MVKKLTLNLRINMFSEQLKIFINYLLKGDIADEWYLSNFIDQHVSNLSPADAFSAIEVVLSELKQHTDLAYELLEIINNLQIVSTTTEIPQSIHDNLSFFKALSLDCREDYITASLDRILKFYHLSL